MRIMHFDLVSCRFRPDVFNAYKNACVDALFKALKDLEPAIYSSMPIGCPMIRMLH